MKYKVRLYEKKLEEVASFSAIKRYLGDLEMMKKLIANPHQVMDTSIKNLEGQIINVSKAGDILKQMGMARSLPQEIADEINQITKKGWMDMKKKAPPTEDINKSIEIFLNKHQTHKQFLDLFVPESGAGTKDPSRIGASAEKNRDVGRKDVFDRA